MPTLKVKDKAEVATILNLSRQKYTRPIRFIEQEIIDRRTNYMKLENKLTTKCIILINDMRIKSS